MTAITFPLNKFPGQVHHNNIGFTGHIIAHPIILGALLLFHLTISLKMGFDTLRIILSFTPALFIISFFMVYLIKFRKRKSDYFGLSLEKFEALFDEDRLFFKKMFSIGFVLSILVWGLSLLYPSIPTLSYLVVNSILMVTVFFRTTLEGIYTSKKLWSVLFILLFIEGFYWILLEYFPLFDFVLIPIIFIFYYRTLQKYETYEPIKLLQKIIT